MADYTERTTCRLCDSSNLSPVLDLGETPLANELDGTELLPLVVNRCGDCEHHQLRIAVKPERLWGLNYPYQSGTSPVFRKHLEALADEVAAMKPGGRVLEIASNDGTLCRMLHERGLSVEGIDPSGPHEATDPSFVLWATEWPTPIPTASEADVILALNVFAHVDDLHSFATAVKDALAPDGVFIVEVGAFADVCTRGMFDTIYHEHMSYHTVRPLPSFFRRHGLELVNVVPVDSQGGSMRLYVRHIKDLALESPPLVGLSLGDSSLQSRVETRGAALREAFAKLQKRGEKVAIYGCPAKLTTLLYATGLQSFPFDCVGDDNPRKVGRTTPGNHIPIVSVTKMLERRPDTIVVAAWNFFDDIRDKLRRLGFSGGIINPMGRVE